MKIACEDCDYSKEEWRLKHRKEDDDKRFYYKRQSGEIELKMLRDIHQLIFGHKVTLYYE